MDVLFKKITQMTNPADRVKVKYSPQFAATDMSHSSDTILIKTRDAVLGEHMQIRRALPSRDRRMIGAWCFLDQAGPADVSVHGMNVAPHPHIGLQTFTWMIEGEILHSDSLGYSQIIRPYMPHNYGLPYRMSSLKLHPPFSTIPMYRSWNSRACTCKC